MNSNDAKEKLLEIRERIDEIDRDISALLQERARRSLEASKSKSILSLPIHDPDREQEVLAGLEIAPPGPLSLDSLRRVFTIIVEECRNLEKELDRL